MLRDRSFGFIEPSVQIFEAVGEDGALQQRYLQLFLPERGSCAAAVPAPVQRLQPPTQPAQLVAHWTAGRQVFVHEVQRHNHRFLGVELRQKLLQQQRNLSVSFCQYPVICARLVGWAC